MRVLKVEVVVSIALTAYLLTPVCDVETEEGRT